MSQSARCFAVIPAAGQSVRMGSQHKLLLPWNGQTVIDQVLRVWTDSVVSQVVIVVRSDDLDLQDACKRWPTSDLVVPDHHPADMKRSIQLGLRQIADQYEPKPSDRWLTAPADLPTLRTPLINRLIEAGCDCDLIVAPRFGGRRGHPVSFPWSLEPEVFRLGENEGVNKLLSIHPVRWLDLPAEDRPEDLDTPEDYARVSKKQSHGSFRDPAS